MALNSTNLKYLLNPNFELLILQSHYRNAVRHSFVKRKLQKGENTPELCYYMGLHIVHCPSIAAWRSRPVARISSNLDLLYRRGLFYVVFEPAPGLHSSFEEYFHAARTLWKNFDIANN